MITLNAVPGRGVHQASRFLTLQLPLIGRTFPAVLGCHPGTINVEFDKGLIVARPDHRTPPLSWMPGGSPEVFDLVQVQFEAPLGTRGVQAWLYVPHHSPHRQTPQLHEVLVGTRLNLKGVSRFRVHLDRDAVELPYATCPLIVVL